MFCGWLCVYAFGCDVCGWVVCDVCGWSLVCLDGTCMPGWVFLGVGGTMPKYITPTFSHLQMYSLHKIHPPITTHTLHEVMK